MLELRTPALPPTVGILDPQARAFCDALAQAWTVRNGQLPTAKDDSFVTRRDLDTMASDAVVRVLGSASGGPNAPLGGNPTVAYNAMVSAVRSIVMSDPIFEFLRTPISLDAPQQRIQQTLDRLNSEVANRIAAVQDEADARATAILNEASTRATADDSLQTQINTIVAAGTSDTATILAALQDEQTARIDADSAESTARQTLATQLRGNYAGTDPTLLVTGLIYNERQARVTAEGAIASDVSALTARMGAAEAGITSEATARANGDSANASQISSLNTRVGNAETAITNEQTARANGDSTNATSITALQSSLGTTNTNVAAVNAAVVSEASTRLSKDSALAAAINNLWANIGGSNAVIEDAALAAISPSAAQATKWNQVVASVTDPNTGQVNAASIKSELTAYANAANGTLNATWAVRANVNGVISGVALMTSAGAGSAPGPATSHFAVMADRLSLIHPTSNGINAVPFSVDGAGNAVFTGTVYAAAGTFGGALSAATGTFAGALTAATGTFAGALSAATGTFAGSLSAATGTFSGVLTAQAINAIDTINIAGEAVSATSMMTQSGGSGTSFAIYMPKAGKLSVAWSSVLPDIVTGVGDGEQSNQQYMASITFDGATIYSVAQYRSIVDGRAGMYSAQVGIGWHYVNFSWQTGVSGLGGSGTISVLALKTFR